MNSASIGLAVVIFLMVAGACERTAGPAAAMADADRGAVSKGLNEEVDLKVGPPEANLAAWITEPPAGTAVRGTVLVLHGFLETHRQVMNAAAALRREGYRAVLVDLRGFGKSKDGGRLTFGVQDAKDLMQLTDYLCKRGLCDGEIGVYGTSYGASCAILYGAADPRVKAIVAVAPFADIHEEVPAFGRGVLGGPEGLGAYISDGVLRAMGDLTARIGDLDLESSKPLEAIAKVRGHILLIHGLDDVHIPPEASKELHAAAPQTSELILLPDRDHLDVSFDPLGELFEPTREWFDKYLAEGNP